MRLIIVRHGETTGNVKEIYQGQEGGTLTKKGIIQHKKLAKRLKDEKIDIIYSSDLRRTKHLAKELLKFHKVPIYYDKLLRERKVGIFEGKKYGSIRKYTEKKGIDYFKFKPSKGESHDDLKRRSEKFYKKIINKYKNTNKTILFVTHGGFIFNLLFRILNLHKHVDKFKTFHTSVTILTINKKGNHKAHIINCIKHL